MIYPSRRAFVGGTLAVAVVAALPVVSTPVEAGSLTITYRNDANAVVGAPRVLTISNANMARLIATMKGNYGQVIGTPAVVVNGVVTVPAVMRDMTNVETVDRWLTGFWQGTRDNIISFERGAAAKTASDAVVVVPE